MALKKRNVKRKIDQLFAKRDSQWEQKTAAMLGNSESVVAVPNKPGMVYARLRNGDTVEVYNEVVPDEPDIRVLIGRTKDQPDLWRVIARREVHSIPTAPRIKHHHAQHEFIEDPGPDTVWVGTKAILSLSVIVSDAENFIVTVIGEVVEIPTGYAGVNSQTLDLSSHIPTTGARYALIEFDEDGALSVVDGSTVGAPGMLTVDDIPAADADQYGFAFVLLFEGMEELSNKHIHLIRKFYGGGSAVMSLFWGNILGTLSDQTDLQDELDGKADVDHEHESTPSHEHTLTRWVADGGDTYDFPDYVYSIESVTLNGWEEDITGYSLSGTNDQIIFGSAVTAGTVIIAHYLPLSV